ncbi:speckle-type POZ protein-like [Phymastichus coffea]|uniref:speckle-type POZ protein-like n=1 Tax=Phymastichus coffea TaxID=108790 RepID=UPI00273A8029|nr:speckle-type POZ protein-like [Phymastichus coffea]XP_058803667.1 speckle-type POZ protein-like [Phymastichus coffea]XP_058803668.1 speckle-type POZ protein-like [Phymastichus coffea]XP_058803669.1 speckle-type POZ protein-like [Phymastichus coffea]
MSTERGMLQNSGKFSIKWKVDQFFAGCQKKGQCYTSPKFAVVYGCKTIKCYLEVYPLGNSRASSTSVSLHLCFESKSRILGSFQLAIMDLKINIPSTLKAGGKFNGTSNTIMGKPDLNQYEFNEISGTLINDTLVILCDIAIEIPDSDVTESFHPYDEWLYKWENILGDFENLLETGTFTDVTFTVENKIINAHKDILSCRSPVFKAMFEHEMKENAQNSVKVIDIDYEVLREMFRFIYSGKVQNIEKIASNLLIAADKYQLIELKALCENTLYVSVTVDKVVEYLKLTEMCDTIHLQKLLIKFIATHYRDVDKIPRLADLNNNILYQIIQAIANHK